MALSLYAFSAILKSILRESRRDSDPSSSSSSSLSTPQYRYDVFPSFYGQDVRRTFCSHILEGLKSKGIKTFTDNGIARSESINSELVRAIKESRIAVVILSKNYASSSWCLDELQLIMECRDTLGQTVMTIFYDVDPSDVRKQTGDFGKAFEETCDGKTEKEKLRWRDALTQVADIAGEHSVSWPSEAEMIAKIIMDVAKGLPSTDFDRLVGMEAHVDKMKSMICLESDEVKIVRIWGPAGIGKTTIAKALYNLISSNFQLKYYKNNVGGKSTGIQTQDHIQNELFSGVLDHKDMKIPNISDVQSRLHHQRVLLTLDDFKPEELQALQELIVQLKYGSKVIVTSEDICTLERCGIDLNHTYKVAYPSSEDAMQIFSYSAFGQSSPPRGYLEHATKVHKLVAPIPLGLKILGASLRGKNKDTWTRTVPRLRTCLDDKDIEKVIRFVYDGLSDKHKNILPRLAISASRGENVNNAIFSLAKGDWDVEKEIQTLADLALISISREGGIILHHLVKSSMCLKRIMWEIDKLYQVDYVIFPQRNFY